MKNNRTLERWKRSIKKRVNQIYFFVLKRSYLEKYVSDIFSTSSNNIEKKEKYIARTKNEIKACDLQIKPIAFYLPQFHPFPENDKWWGKGFTEWTNVTKAQPQCLGHYQPHLPLDLGFYDLRLIEVMHEQAKMAKEYGIYGFCFYNYWFAGKKLMQRPIENLLKDKEVDINFCLCWANENWSRRWDGKEDDVLIAQRHSPEDDILYIESLRCAFNDERYIHIDGKPLFLIYRAALLPDAKETVARWRKWATDNKFRGLYIVSVQSFDITDPRDFGCDAAVEFPPNQGMKAIATDVKLINSKYQGKIFDYEALVKSYQEQNRKEYTCFKTVMPSWDNEARKPGKGYTFIDSSPQIFGKWLESACNQTMQNRPEERVLFINAWNEWAEGAHMEPCRQYGYAFLEEARDVLKRYCR